MEANQSGLDSVVNSFLAGTRSDVSDRIHRASIALLASVCLSAAGPLLVEEMVVENPLSRVGHTHTHTHTPPVSCPPVN